MKKKIIIAMILYFFMNVFNNFGHPVTPSFVRQLEIPEYMFGVYYASMSFGLLLAAPFWGSLGDAAKNKMSISVGLLIYAGSQIGFSFSHNQYLMVLFRFIAGIGIAAPMTLFISLVMSYSSENRIMNLSILAAIATLGISLGYQVGGILGDSQTFQSIIHTPSYENVFILQASFMVLLSIAVLLLVKEPNLNVAPSKRKNSFASLVQIKSLEPKLILFLISLTLITMGSTNLSKYIDVYFNDLGLSTTSLGNFVLVTGIVSVFTSIFLVPLVSKLKKQLTFIILIQVLSSLIVLFSFRTSSFLLAMYTVYNIYVVAKAVYQPLEQNYISRHADNESIGKITGIRQSFVSIGNVIGPLFGGVLYSVKPLLLFDVSAVLFLLGAILLLLVLFMGKKADKVTMKNSMDQN